MKEDVERRVSGTFKRKRDEMEIEWWWTVTRKLPQWKFRNPETEPTLHSFQHTK